MSISIGVSEGRREVVQGFFPLTDSSLTGLFAPGGNMLSRSSYTRSLALSLCFFFHPFSFMLPITLLSLGGPRDAPSYFFTFKFYPFLLFLFLYHHPCNFALSTSDPPPTPRDCRPGREPGGLLQVGESLAHHEERQVRTSGPLGYPSTGPHLVIIVPISWKIITME